VIADLAATEAGGTERNDEISIESPASTARSVAHRLIPNMLTIGALCAGLTAVHFGLQGFWKRRSSPSSSRVSSTPSMGRIARLLNGSSKFGAELDSLSDFVSSAWRRPCCSINGR